MENKDIMEVTGIPNSKVFVSQDGVFQNTSCLFFEYYDVIKMPWLAFIDSIINLGIYDELIELDDMKKMERGELFAWYVKRKNRTVLLNLNYKPDALKKSGITSSEDLISWTENFINDEMDKMEYFFNDYYFLNFRNTLEIIIKNNLIVDNFVCYTEAYSKFVERDLKAISNSIEYRYGDIDVVLEDIPERATFVLSDAMKLYNILNANKLDYSSIVLTDYFGYNFIDDNLILDPKVFENHIFKLDMFDNISE